MNRELLQQALNALRISAPLGHAMEDYEFRNKVIKDIESELAKPEQAPVAYRHLHEDGYEYYDAPTGIDCNECESLYTAPPRKPWVGLTNEDIEFIKNFRNIAISHADFRAIEAQIKVKNYHDDNGGQWGIEAKLKEKNHGSV